MKCVLHIGLNKTGTSPLQIYLSAHRDALRQAGILYPDFGIYQSGHHLLSRVARGAPPEQVGIRPDWADELARILETPDCRLAVFSSENFGSIPDPNRLLRYFARGSTRIVLYLREHAAYLSSWYRQRIVQQNSACSFEEFVDLFPLSFVRLIGGWQEAFGAGNVIVRVYERDKLKDRDIVGDFFDSIGEALPAPRSDNRGANQSISGNLLFLKRALNTLITRQESHLIADDFPRLATLDPHFRGKLDVSPDMLAKIARRYADDRRDLRRRFGIELPAARDMDGGIPSPELDRLESDLRLIINSAVERQLRSVPFLNRLAALRVLAGPLAAMPRVDAERV